MNRGEHSRSGKLSNEVSTLNRRPATADKVAESTCIGAVSIRLSRRMKNCNLVSRYPNPDRDSVSCPIGVLQNLHFETYPVRSRIFFRYGKPSARFSSTVRRAAAGNGNSLSNFINQKFLRQRYLETGEWETFSRPRTRTAQCFRVPR